MRVPHSTYRLQLTSDFTLYDAEERLPGLHDLGVDWVYLSPILAATAGSTHGYDVVDHDRIDDARGGPDGLRALSRTARALGMGVLVDIVPNHMGIEAPAQNRAWWSVLRHGRESAYAGWFDIDWALSDRVRVPVVGDDDLGQDGHIRNLAVVDGELRYHGHRFPIAPGTEHADPQQVHARQHYELIGWRRADHELNYRRFFGINTLAGLRVEDPAVFAATHREIGRWFTEGLIDGLRVDHPDGLRDPGQYLARLRELTGGAYLVIEKILEPGEQLPPWECEGTTGYDTLALIDRVLTDPAGEKPLTQLAEDLAGAPVSWPQMIHGTKRAIADHTLGSEVRRLAREVPTTHGDGPAHVAADANADPRERPQPLAFSATEDAIAELLACFPVYRSYLPRGAEHLLQAVADAKQHRPDLIDQIDRLHETLADPRTPAGARFQQTSGMVMAKGVEDTAFYRYSRLTSLNEVGGDPSVYSIDTAEFHAEMTRRQAQWPHAMNALSTHDTKRGEDTRARITAISEFPEKYADLLARISRHAPQNDASLINLIVQAAVGAWPVSIDRLSDYAVKAAREAATTTRWTAPSAGYEEALQDFVDAMETTHVGREVERFVDHVSESWEANLLAAKLLSLVLPGVPDVYQGSEGLEASLVDPDNRRPVAWEALDTLRHKASRPVSDRSAIDVIKARVVRECLLLRRDRPDVFHTYQGLEVTGDAARHALAFTRGGAIAVVTRFPRSLRALGGWRDTTVEVPAGRWVERFTGAEHAGGSLSLSSLLSTLPVALLVREENQR